MSNIPRDETSAAKEVNEQINKICAAANLPALNYDEQIKWDCEGGEGDDPPYGFIVGSKRFGYYRHMVEGYKPSLEAAKQACLTSLSPKILSQMYGWFNSSDIQRLMTQKGEQAEFHRIVNAATAILRGLDM